MILKFNLNKILKSLLLLGILVISIGSFTKATAATCAVNPRWYVNNGDGTNSLVSGSIQTDTNKQYYAVADFTDCVGYRQPYINIYLDQSSTYSNASMVASAITQSPEQHNVPVKFTQSGTYYFKIFISPQNAGSQYLLKQSDSLVVTVATPQSNSNPTNTQPNTQNQPTSPNQAQQAPTTAKVDCTQNPNSNDCLINPLPTNDLLDMLLRIVKGFLVVIGGWSVAFIIIGGFRMVASQGNSEAYEAAQRTITWAVLGMVIALLSFSIVAIVQNLIGASIKPLN